MRRWIESMAPVHKLKWINDQHFQHHSGDLRLRRMLRGPAADRRGPRKDSPTFSQTTHSQKSYHKSKWNKSSRMATMMRSCRRLMMSIRGLGKTCKKGNIRIIKHCRGMFQRGKFLRSPNPQKTDLIKSISNCLYRRSSNRKLLIMRTPPR